MKCTTYNCNGTVCLPRGAYALASPYCSACILARVSAPSSTFQFALTNSKPKESVSQVPPGPMYVIHSGFFDLNGDPMPPGDASW